MGESGDRKGGKGWGYYGARWVWNDKTVSESWQNKQRMNVQQNEL